MYKSLSPYLTQSEQLKGQQPKGHQPLAQLQNYRQFFSIQRKHIEAQVPRKPHATLYGTIF